MRDIHAQPYPGGVATSGRGGGEGPRTRDHLANVRTLLAWVRVGLVLMALGYTVDRLGAIEIGRRVAPANPLRAYGLTAVGAGTLAVLAALGRYLRQRRLIEGAALRTRVAADVVLVAIVGLGGIGLLVLVTLVR